jgi:hypothetical protein
VITKRSKFDQKEKKKDKNKKRIFSFKTDSMHSPCFQQKSLWALFCLVCVSDSGADGCSANC